MAEQERKPATSVQKKNYRFGNRAGQLGPKSPYKSNVIGLEEDTFVVGASRDPAKSSTSLKSFENNIKKHTRCLTICEGNPADEATDTRLPRQASQR